MVILQKVVTLMEGEWSCYRGGHFNGGSMAMLHRSPVEWREIAYVMEVVCLMEEEWSYRGGYFNGGRMVMLQRWC